MGTGHVRRVRAAVWGQAARSRIHPSGLVYRWRPPFGCTACGASQVVLCGGLTPASRCAGSVVPWEGLPCRPRSATAFDCSELPGSCKGIRALLPRVLGWEARGRDHARSRGGPAKGPVRLDAWGRPPAPCPEGSAAVRALGWHVSWAGPGPRASPGQSEQVSLGRCRVAFCASAEPVASCRSLRSQHGQPLPTMMSPQTPESLGARLVAHHGNSVLGCVGRRC